MSNQYNINSNNVIIGEGSEGPTLKSCNGNRIRGELDIVDNDDADLFGYDLDSDTIVFYRGIDFNNQPYINLAGGAAIVIPDDIEVEKLKVREVGLNNPNVTIEKEGVVLTSADTSSIIFTDSSASSTGITSISKTGGSEDLNISASINKNFNLNLVGNNGGVPKLKINNVEFNSTNLSDGVTLLNTTSINQVKLGTIQIGNTGDNCLIDDGTFKISKQLTNPSLEFAATGGNTRTFIQHNITDNNLDIFPGSGIEMDVNLKSSSTYQPKLLFDGVALNTSNLSDSGSLLNTSSTEQVKIGALSTSTLKTNNMIINTDSGGSMSFKKSTLDNNIEVRGDLSNQCDLNLVRNDVGYQTNIRFDGVPISSTNLSNDGKLLKTDVNQIITGINTFSSFQILNNTTPLRLGTNELNYIQGSGNDSIVSAAGNLDLNTNNFTEIRIGPTGNISLCLSGNGKCFYKNTEPNDEITNRYDVEEMIQVELGSNGTLETVKNNIIEGGYGGTADPNYNTNKLNPLSIDEFQHTLAVGPSGIVWTPSSTLNTFNVNCNTTISSTKDILGPNSISVFRELQLLRDHFTTPEWTNMVLDSDNFIPGDYWEAPQYTRIRYGDSYEVTLRGEVKETNDYFNNTDNVVIFNLPAGYRPQRRELYSCSAANGRAIASLLVNGDGNILFLGSASIPGGGGTITNVYLDGISFFTN
tara:strand:+ start:728 stop:2821 length:2094 start_codon:yes stop_codon:yes gene_type:complete